MTIVESLECRCLLSAYYINAQLGSDLNTGRSPNLPWQSLASVADHSFRRGDRINLTGTFVNQTLQLGPNALGVSVNTYGLIGPRKILRIGLPNAAVLTAEQSDGIDITTSFITVQNLTITADPAVLSSGNYNYGIHLHNTTSSPLTREMINNVNVSGFSYSGLCMQGWNTSTTDSAGFSNVLIENSAFHDNQVSGIFAAAGDSNGTEFAPGFPDNFYEHSNLTIRNCQAFNNAGFNPSLMGAIDSTDLNQGSFSSGGIFISSVNGAMVQHCTVYNNCFGAQGSVGLWAFDATHVVFQNDESYDNKTTAVDGDGFDFDHGVTNSLMQDDYSHGNAGAGFFLATYGGTSNNNGDTIRYCVADDNAQGISVLTIPNVPILYANIYNNTVLQADTSSSSSAAISITGGATAASQINILNNIFYSAGADPLVSLDAAGSGIKFERNDYWLAAAPGVIGVSLNGTTYTTLADWSAASGGMETNGGMTLGLNHDPMLVSESVSDVPMTAVGSLALGAASPLRREGENLATRPWAGSPPYNLDAPYNLAGRAWNGLGRVNFFGRPLNRIAVGAG